jgi:hypothetical protein
MPTYDVFNGDADGLIARHQYRLAFPASHIRLVTGVKRDVALLSRVEASPGDHVFVFDVSYDTNAESAQELLQRGVHISYFDHHRATLLTAHPLLDAHIDTSARMCSSLIVDRFLGGRFRTWAIVAAFGDNLAQIASEMAVASGLSDDQTAMLRQLGEGLNYNAYGDDVTDLWFDPQSLAQRLASYNDPFAFIEHEDVFTRLNAGYANDLGRALAIDPVYSKASLAIYALPDEAWARRIGGSFGNYLSQAYPNRAHAICTCAPNEQWVVSLRAPLSQPVHADSVASQFPTGGGRAAAAGINAFPPARLAELIAAMQTAWSE